MNIIAKCLVEVENGFKLFNIKRFRVTRIICVINLRLFIRHKIHPYRSVIAQISPLGVSPFPLARDVSITAAKTRKVGNNAFLMGESKFFLMNHLNFSLLNPLKLSVCRKERLDISIQGFDFAEFVFFHFYSLLCISHFYTRIYTTRWLVTSLTSKII